MDRHPGDGPPAAAAVPRRLLETGRGSRSESFGVTEWLLAVPVLLRAQLAALVLLLLDERVAAAAAAVAGTALVVGGAWLTSRRER